MKENAKTGLRLAAIHTVVVLIAILLVKVFGLGPGYPVWWLILSADLPAGLLLLFEVVEVPDEQILDRAIFFALLLGIVGAVWWFSLGWLVGSLSTAKTAKVRFMSGLVIAIIAILFALTAQFLATAPNLAHDGCASAGFPLPFFRGCYGALGLSWPGVSVSKAALALDGFVWIATASVLSYYLSRKKIVRDDEVS